MRGAATGCNACPVKSKCTTSDHGRKGHRSFYVDYLKKVRGYHQTEVYKKAMCNRQVWVKPLFAEAKEWHGLRRLRLLVLLNANIQRLLIAAGQNLSSSWPLRVGGGEMPHSGVAWPSRESHRGSWPSLRDDRSDRSPGHRRAGPGAAVTTTRATGGFFNGLNRCLPWQTWFMAAPAERASVPRVGSRR